MKKTLDYLKSKSHLLLTRAGTLMLFLMAICAAFLTGAFIGPELHQRHEAQDERHASEQKETRNSQRENRPSTNHQELFEQILAVPAEDPARTVELLGALVRVSDSGVREMWGQLLRAAPRLDGAANMMCAYLWKRMCLITPDTAMPDGWEMDRFSEVASLSSEEGLASTRARLEAGENVSENERRLFFSTEIARDPIAAMKLWASCSNDGEYSRELQLFSRSFTREALRESLLKAALEWNAKLQNPSNTAYIVSLLIEDWMASDPLAVEKWLAAPERADYREELMGNLASTMVRLDPEKAWQWSEHLPESQRLSTRIHGLMELAMRNPQLGMRQLDTVSDDAARKTLVPAFSMSYAMNAYDQWETWRDALPSQADQDRANVAAFDTWMGRSPEKSLTWLGTYQGPERVDLISSMALRSASDDPAGVAVWIKSLQSPDDRRAAASAALRGIPGNDHKAIQTILDVMK